ncbi:MAG: type IV secretory system conjugative DNA transfer family protein [Hyphomicrobiaceae bacterium]|nr:type IV secretory system conjugative DNA transfer family protein [Hyphomicrobiaceae bacterium]
MLIRFLLVLLTRSARVAWIGTKATLRFIRHCCRRRAATFGSARFAHTTELVRWRVVGGEGLILARTLGRFVRFNNPEGSAVVFAPQGAGKGVGPVISNLLDYKGSIVVTDPKGENLAVTGRFRAKLGQVHTINLLDPEWSDQLNPLDMIRIGTPHEVVDAEALAELMLDKDPHEESHWRERAKSWLTGLLLFVLHAHIDQPELQTLAQVHRLATGDRKMLEGTLDVMTAMPQGRIRESAQQIIRALDTEEAMNILSNLVKGTEAWSLSKPLGVLSGRSSFDPRSFYNHTQTLYLVVPEERLAVYGPALRVIVGMMLHGIVEAGKRQAPPRHRPLFLLDEAAALGYLEPLENGMGYLRAYARALLIFQDLDQLQRTYHKWRSLLANCGAHVFWSVNDMETAKLVAERIGHATVRTRSSGMSQGHDAVIQHQAQSGQGEAGRLLVDASEVMRLSPDEVLVFMNQQIAAPIRARRVMYFKERCFKGRWDRWRSGVGEFWPARADKRVRDAEASGGTRNWLSGLTPVVEPVRIQSAPVSC